MRLAATICILIAMAIPTRASSATYPPGWKTAATCIHLHEEIDWHYGPNHHPARYRWNGYYGGFQFVIGTWHSTFLPGEPHGHTYEHPEDASIGEQYHRAFINWIHNGHRFGGGQWPTSSAECHVL